MESTQYPYSLKFSIGTIILMLLLLGILFVNVLQANTVLTWIVFGFIGALFFSMLILLVLKRLIPAIKGDISLELTEDLLIDYIRNITIEWKDIKGIKLLRGRSASTLQVELNWESDYGKQINIPLRWVTGKDSDIYDAVLAYFEQAGIVE